jgi:hypothetical protein
VRNTALVYLLTFIFFWLSKLNNFLALGVIDSSSYYYYYYTVGDAR